MLPSYNVKICPETDLVVDGVELGEHDAVDELWVVSAGVVGQGSVELDQLVHCFVAHERLAHKGHQVGGVHFDQLHQNKHNSALVIGALWLYL